ncbi:MAG TPA: cytochrome c [Acidobacteriota bacterium]|nr:cytochrome c [Acidobacteriota bacterium]
MSIDTLKRTINCLLIILVGVAATQVFASDQKTPGEELYKTKCASCHGADGKGETKVGKLMQTPDLTKTPWKHGSSQADAEKIVREGWKKMPKYEGKLDSKQIAAVTRYLRKLAGLEK